MPVILAPMEATSFFGIAIATIFKRGFITTDRNTKKDTADSGTGLVIEQKI